jgi:low affinity Fe/Cu permease
VASVTEQTERPAADARESERDKRSPFERFVETAQSWVTRPAFFFACLVLVLVWMLSFPLWADLKTWAAVIHTVSGVLSLLLLALLENAGRRAEEASQEKLNVIAEALAALMASRAAEDPELEGAVESLRDAVGLEKRH